MMLSAMPCARISDCEQIGSAVTAATLPPAAAAGLAASGEGGVSCGKAVALPRHKARKMLLRVEARIFFFFFLLLGKRIVSECWNAGMLYKYYESEN